ncbi:hypothetical protein KDC22_11650 [Paenibacillus tritici]|uniref:phosphopantetheine-binding protein n=1 Tax=Paenibacillus tritici TaxID=1873425 RepID=UPI001BAA646D|nr:phosphopantetheine-binding protein [Paenibacillus tritici]QUL57063.1 hypothetical protein KDC22_11650 [Paenibacillus tritici]
MRDSMIEIEQKLKLIVAQNAIPTTSPDVIVRTSRPIEDLGMDSMQIINLFAIIEIEFGITIFDDMFAPEAIETFGGLVEMVKTCIKKSKHTI